MVSGMPAHNAAAARKAAAMTMNENPNPFVWASEPTANGAAALTMRPAL
jgi:hypothetical protein